MTLQEIRKKKLKKHPNKEGYEMYLVGESIIMIEEDLDAVQLLDRKGKVLTWEYYHNIHNLEEWVTHWSLTPGERLCRVDYIPGNNSKIQNIKERLAKVVDQIDKHLPSTIEVDKVMDHLQLASMYLDRVRP